MNEDQIRKLMATSLDEALSDNKLKWFEPVSDIRIVPVNNQILIRVCFSESVLNLVKTSSTRPFLGAKFIVAGTSNRVIPYGKEVYLNNRVVSNTELRVVYPENKKSRDYYYQFLNTLESKDRLSFTKSNPTVNIEEYMIINAMDVIAILEPVKD